MRMRQWGLLAAGMMATVVAASAAGAQNGDAPKKKRGLTGFLDKVNKTICGQDGSACAPDGTGGTNAVAGGSSGRSGSALRIVRQGFEGGDSTAASVPLDSGVTRTRATAACGAGRLCIAGWDLRVVSVTVPDSVMPGGARVGVATLIENRGRAPSPPSEVRLCWGRATDRCEQPIETLPVPALTSGERVRIAYPVVLANLPQYTGGQWTISASVDPDNATGEANRQNNTGVTGPFKVDYPALQFLSFEVPASIRAGSPLPVSIRVRNKSLVARSQATEVQLSGRSGCQSWGDGATRLAVPALAPRQVWSAAVMVQHRNVSLPLFAACEVGLYGAFDPDRKQHWAESQEGSIRRTYTVAGSQ